MKTAASVGDPLDFTKVDLKENPEADPFSVARNIALRQLSLAPRSRLQLEQSLAKRKVLPEVAGPVLDRLTEVGLIDDLAYAGMFVRSRCLTKKVSRSVLKMELRKKGISDEYIEVALGEISDADEYQMATDLVLKKLRSMSNLELEVKQRRLFGLLARKGYNSSIALRVIKEQLAEIQQAS